MVMFVCGEVEVWEELLILEFGYKYWVFVLYDKLNGVLVLRFLWVEMYSECGWCGEIMNVCFEFCYVYILL